MCIISFTYIMVMNGKWLSRPRWLTNSPAVFQAVVNDVLWDILNTFLYFMFDWF